MKQIYRIYSLSVFLIMLLVTLPLQAQNIKKHDLTGYFKNNSGNILQRKVPVMNPEQKALTDIRQLLFDHTRLAKTSTAAVTWWLEHSEVSAYDLLNNRMALSSRTYYAYNDNDKVFDQMDQAYDTANSIWANTHRIKTSYDASGNVLEITYQLWANNQWNDSSRVQFTYTNNLETKALYQKYISNTYVNQYQYLYTYDSNGNLIEDRQQNWDQNQNTWVDYDRYQYTYSNNLVTGGTYQLWITDKWVNDERYTFNYNPQNILSEEIQEKYDTLSNTYTNQYRYKYQYYITTKKDSAYVEYEWNLSSKIWEYSSQILYTYNVNGDYDTWIYQDWDINSKMFVNSAKYVFTYDVNLNLTNYDFYIWDGGQWFAWVKQANFYTNVRPGQLPTPIKRSPVTSPTKIKLFQNYPNPFNPATRISYELSEPQNVKLVVYDLIGRQVAQLVNTRQSAGLHTVVFSGDKLSSGIYFYRLITNNLTMTKKMILLK